MIDIQPLVDGGGLSRDELVIFLWGAIESLPGQEDCGDDDEGVRQSAEYEVFAEFLEGIVELITRKKRPRTVPNWQPIIAPALPR